MEVAEPERAKGEVDDPHGEDEPIELGAFEMREVAEAVAVEEERE